MNPFRIGRFLCLGLSIGLCFSTSSVYSADAESKFAVDGAGLATCQRYIESIDRKTTDFFLFSGWVDGYISGFNRFTPETYDYTAWQSNETLSKAIYRYCKKQPKLKFFQVVDKLALSLFDDRLKKRSKAARIQSSGKGTVIYVDVLRSIRENLAEMGYLNDSGGNRYDDTLRIALRKFQKDKKLNITGLPDQNTLLLLLASDNKGKASK